MKFTVRGIIAAVFVLLVAGVCVRLGLWQLDRLKERRARNEAVRSATALPPLVLDAATAAAVTSDPDAYVWRRVRVRGRYAPAGAVVLRARAREGNPGVHVVAPLVLGDGRVVMVNRGWVRSPDAATVDRSALRPETGEVTVTGVLLPVETRPDGGMPAGRVGDDTTYRRLDLAALRARTPGEVLPVHVQQLADGAVSDPPIPVPLPEMGEGNHLSYAVQWFSFAAIAVIGFGVVALRRRRA